MGKNISEFASELGITNEQMMELLCKDNIKVESILDELTDSEEKQIINKFNYLINQDSDCNKSILEEIRIEGLFGRKEYKINFEKDMNIFISENGSGKTTILNIIVSVLKGDYEKLRTIQFKTIALKIKGETYYIDKESIVNKREFGENINHSLRRIREVVTAMEYRYIKDQLFENKYIDIENLKLNILNRRRHNYEEFHINDYTKLEYLLDNLQHSNKISNGYKNNQQYKKTVNTMNKIANLVNTELEVMYFPTFRRVEEELDKIVDIRGNTHNDLKYKINNSSINFGVSDVQNTLDNLTEKLKEDANSAYTKMNAEVLNDLLSNKSKLTEDEKLLIDKEKVNIVIGRIGEEKINELEKLKMVIEKESKIDLENIEFLEYYIYKLISIYESQKGIDERIKKYIGICNKYLVNKELTYNEVSPKVTIRDKFSGEHIPFRDLSSGEKQILSLFSRLYLSISKPCIFIIDEPELSLSIRWQKMLLEDIYESNKIALLIATTHSPFIFRNKFTDYAIELDCYEVEKNDEKQEW